MSTLSDIGVPPAPEAIAPPSRVWGRFDAWTSGAKGPALAALLVLISALPGLFALPPLDRDEARFAQATAQMLETGDVVNIRYQAEPRDKKPIGVNWLQAASVKLLSAVERREIWAYRIPSLFGAMLAAAACAWGASVFFGARAGFFAGAILGASFLLSSEAFIAKTDAVLCGAVTLAMAALGRIYGASKGVGTAGVGVRALFWFGLGLSIIDKGPVGPAVIGMAMIALIVADRQVGWLKSLGWAWGPILLAVMLGPWIVAITVSTDGTFWTGMNGDIAPKLAGGHQSHGGPPGLHAVLAPLLIFPSSFLILAALIAGWRGRAQPGVRFALAWLIPTWIAFELLPTKLVHYTLPAYGALAWLAAAAMADPAKAAFGPWARRIGGGLALLTGFGFALIAGVAARKYGDAAATLPAIIAGGLAIVTGVAGALALFKRRMEAGLLASLALGVLAHMAMTGLLAPRLSALWMSQRAADRLAKDHLDPRNGVTTGPVAVVGYAEPSLVFALGTETELDSPADAADSVADGQPAIVERRRDAAFRAALKAQRVPAQPVDEINGFDYSLGKPVDLVIWKSLAPTPADGS